MGLSSIHILILAVAAIAGLLGFYMTRYWDKPDTQTSTVLGFGSLLLAASFLLPLAKTPGGKLYGFVYAATLLFGSFCYARIYRRTFDQAICILSFAVALAGLLMGMATPFLMLSQASNQRYVWLCVGTFPFAAFGAPFLLHIAQDLREMCRSGHAGTWLSNMAGGGKTQKRVGE